MPESFSKWFSFEELTNSSHTSLVEQNRKDAMKFALAGKRLSKLLESIRELLGNKPLTISSGFRNEALNARVGGSKTSGHKRFECADVVPTNMSTAEAFKIIMENKDKLPDLRKCIIEGVKGKNWLHIQVSMKAGDKQEFYSTSDGKTYTKVV